VSYLMKHLNLSLVAVIMAFSTITAFADFNATSASVTVINNYKYTIGTNTSLYNPSQYYTTSSTTSPSTLPSSVPSGSNAVFTYSVCPSSNPNCTVTEKMTSTPVSNYITYANMSGSTLDPNNSCTFYYSMSNCATYPSVGKGIYSSSPACSICSATYNSSTKTCTFVFGMAGCSGAPS
jgi:hypothetical protein